MNYTAGSFNGYNDPQHKPRISMIKDGSDIYYICSDGGLEQFGNTPQEAFNALSKLR